MLVDLSYVFHWHNITMLFKENGPGSIIMEEDMNTAVSSSATIPDFSTKESGTWNYPKFVQESVQFREGGGMVWDGISINNSTNDTSL